MYKTSVMYPNQKAVRFDFNYYQTKHMDLVKKHLKPFGLIKADVEKGISGGGDQPAPYICIGNLYNHLLFSINKRSYFSLKSRFKAFPDRFLGIEGIKATAFGFL